MAVSFLVMPFLITSANGVIKKPRFRSIRTRDGSTITRASSPLRDTESSLSLFQVQDAPYSVDSFPVASLMRFFASSAGSVWGMSSWYLGTAPPLFLVVVVFGLGHA